MPRFRGTGGWGWSSRSTTTPTKGRKPKPLETMARMYLLQVWFSLSDEGVEDAVYDSYAMRRFVGLDFAAEQVPMPRRCWGSGI